MSLSNTGLAPLLTRSSCRLHRLSLSLRAHANLECFDLLPELTSLKIDACEDNPLGQDVLDLPSAVDSKYGHNACAPAHGLARIGRLCAVHCGLAVGDAGDPQVNGMRSKSLTFEPRVYSLPCDFGWNDNIARRIEELVPAVIMPTRSSFGRYSI